jgi:lipid II:glycine glycyltransferase (peptidoglycan interpeptide bridge formation enzyme)
MLDLSQSTEALLADMKQKGRYNIKVAEKSDCVALLVDATSANIDVFYALLLETTQRDGFFSNQKSYYERLLAERNHPAE